MTTRKQVRDRIILDDQQRAANGQFGTGSGTSTAKKPHPNSKEGKAIAKQQRAAHSAQVLKEQVIANQNVGSSMHKAMEYGKVERKSMPYQQQETAKNYARARRLMGIEDTIKGIKGLMDALDSRK